MFILLLACEPVKEINVDPVEATTSTPTLEDSPPVHVDSGWTRTEPVDTALDSGTGPWVDSGADSGTAPPPDTGTDPGPDPNEPPGAPVIALSPDPPGAGYDDVACDVVGAAIDPEGALVTYQVAWELDGDPWGGAVETRALAGDTIPAAETAEGQVWTCRVTASDGESDGPPAEADVSVAPTLLLDGVDATLTEGTWDYAVVALTGGATLTVQGEVVLTAREVVVDATSTIDGDGGGWLGGVEKTDGTGPAPGQGKKDDGGSGAGHGGLGGDGGDTLSFLAGGAEVGALDTLEALAGSGGGGSGGAYAGEDGLGGAGGAGVWIAAQEITVDGVITVSGLAGETGTDGAGGGAGGTILLQGDVVEVSGSLVADGGIGGDGTNTFGYGGGGGAGGRIKVFYDTSLDVGGAYVSTTGGWYGYGWLSFCTSGSPGTYAEVVSPWP
ncbi:MAG: hypothetical protein ABMA64_33525 [Myxococcota bacterium]